MSNRRGVIALKPLPTAGYSVFTPPTAKTQHSDNQLIEKVRFL